MPKRASDADSRIFFDELESLGVSRLRAAGTIRLEDRQVLILLGGRIKLIGVAHAVFKNGGSWSYFRCAKCGGRKKKLWLVDDTPRCLSCCWAWACVIARPMPCTLRLRYPVENLEEPLSEGIITRNPAMPEFSFDPSQISDIIAYFKSLER
jgi:hypothetical protein